MQDDLNKFLSFLETKFKGKAGNKALRMELGWDNDENRYWTTHGRAKDLGYIVPGMGRGGSVQLIRDHDVNGDYEDEGKVVDHVAPKEKELYEPARKVVEESWVKAESYDQYIVRITGLRGAAVTGGKWTRPDISLLGSKAYPY